MKKPRLFTQIGAFLILTTVSLWTGAGVCSVYAQSPASTAPESADDVRAGFTVIDSISKLRQAMASSHAKVRMKAGNYRVTDAVDDDKTVFMVSGSDNYFDLRGVTLQLDTAVLAGMRGKVHSLTVYRVSGDRIVFEGGRFEDTGDHAPNMDLSEFDIAGDDITFLRCSFSIRGSAPYGYGDMYGKGSDHAVKLEKHAAMNITGDRALVDGCDFHIHTFGHGIHLHGAQNTVIRNVTMEGELRRTEEIYNEKNGLAARFDYKMMFPPWSKGKPIPHNQMLSLTEDGIRAYVNGTNKSGHNRRTGFVTVENCVIKKMRGGISLDMAASAKVTGCTVMDCGGYAYSLPSNGVVRDCQGNAAFSPLLVLPYSEKHNADIELKLLGSREEMGDHPLALISGTNHRIRITTVDEQTRGTLRPIIVGSAGDRYAEDDTDAREVTAKNKAVGITLENLTPNPVHLTGEASGCHATSQGLVDDQGTGNIIAQTRSP